MVIETVWVLLVPHSHFLLGLTDIDLLPFNSNANNTNGAINANLKVMVVINNPEEGNEEDDQILKIIWKRGKLKSLPF